MIVALLIISGLLFLPVVALVACMCFLLMRVPWGLNQTDATGSMDVARHFTAAC